MKHISYLILILLVASCGPASVEENKKEEGEESFQTFFKKFESDSVFQEQRVKFPFKQIIWGDEENDVFVEEVKQHEWSFLDLEYKEEYGKRPIDAYKQDLVIYTDSAKVILRGVDNGINVDFAFSMVEGQWFLVSCTDYSN